MRMPLRTVHREAFIQHLGALTVNRPSLSHDNMGRALITPNQPKFRCHCRHFSCSRLPKGFIPNDPFYHHEIERSLCMDSLVANTRTSFFSTWKYSEILAGLS